MSIARLVLDYLAVLLSGAVLGSAVVLAFLLIFKLEIRGLVQRIASIKFPGGELSTTQEAKLQVELARSEQNVALPGVENVPALAGLQPNDRAQMEALIRSERQTATLWEYRYLNLFLVRGTQIVLDWLIGKNAALSVHQYDAELAPWIVSANERVSILNALQNHHLVNIVNQLIEMTPKGREYQQWRGPLPQVPLPNPGPGAV